MDTDRVRQRRMHIHFNKNPSFDGSAKPPGELRHKAKSAALMYIGEESGRQTRGGAQTLD